MHDIGQLEIDAIAKVIKSGRLFRYNAKSECERFEQRYAKYIGVKHAHMTSSGTTALTAALTGLGVGPGDEVLVPAHTYMATAVSVLAVGAIPVIVDVDESITISPESAADLVGPRTRAIIPVHMWGLSCNMNAIMRLARKHKLLVLEDACQAVGGGYEGKMLGSIGHAGAYSFNFFKNMTCGEGGAVVTNDKAVAEIVHCSVDCCRFYWNGTDGSLVPFTASGSRASEIEGAMMNAQLDRLPGMIKKLRAHKKQILRNTTKSALTPNPAHSLDWECGTHLHYLFDTSEQADQFAVQTGGTVCGKTGRHTANNWNQVVDQSGAPHPALDPFKLPANKKCRKNYSAKVFARSLDILNRTVMITMRTTHTPAQLATLTKKIIAAAKK